MEQKYEERYKHLAKIIPSMANIAKGFLADPINIDLVGCSAPEGVAILPPFIKVEEIIDAYWAHVEDGRTIVVKRFGQEADLYDWDGVGWIKKNATLEQTQPFTKGDEPPSWFKV